mgnify:CR=1 FL=1
MKLLFIRHSIALEREDYSGDDLLRPLTQEGCDVAEDFFSKLQKIYKNIDLIISSKATRGLETSRILNKYFKDSVYKVSPLLNPGMKIKEFRLLFDSLEEKYDSIAFVGHEPDFSHIISYITTCAKGDILIKLKKPSCVEIELFDHSQLVGELRNIISPRILKKC